MRPSGPHRPGPRERRSARGAGAVRVDHRRPSAPSSVARREVARWMRWYPEAGTPVTVARHVRRDISLAALAPFGSVVGWVVHCSTEAAVARDAARAVGSGQPADQAQRGPRHSRHATALGGRPFPTGQATGRLRGEADAARADMRGHPTHRIGVDERREGHRRTRVAWRYERVPDQRCCVVLRPDHGLGQWTRRA